MCLFRTDRETKKKNRHFPASVAQNAKNLAIVISSLRSFHWNTFCWWFSFNYRYLFLFEHPKWKNIKEVLLRQWQSAVGKHWKKERITLANIERIFWWGNVTQFQAQFGQKKTFAAVNERTKPFMFGKNEQWIFVFGSNPNCEL